MEVSFTYQMDWVLVSSFIALLFFVSLFVSSWRGFLFNVLVRRYLLKGFLFPLLNNKFFQLIVPGVATAYFLCLDVWGGDWEIIENYKDTHSIIFSVLIGLSITALFTRALHDLVGEKADKEYISFLESFSLLTSRVVNAKLERFKGKAGTLSPGGDTFKQITQPTDQINIIISEIEHFLHTAFRIPESQLRITILHEDVQAERWHYPFRTHPSWTISSAEVLIQGASTAKECLDTGEPRFYADKVKASKEGHYMMSSRDERHGTGSVFCYPVFVENADYTDRFIISIVTYGPTLCDPYDDRLVAATKTVFNDICRRLELELTLYSIRKWKFQFHSNRTRAESESRRVS